MEKELKLSPPWVTYYREINALFGEDPDIKIEFDEDECIIKMYVTGQDKADALEQLLPLQKEFGSVVVYTEIIPANREATKCDLIRKAFEGNPAFSFAAAVEGVFTNPLTYAVFKNKVVQIWSDNIGDINGNISTLYQDIAKNIFGEIDGVCYCTDLPGNYAKTK